MDQNNKKAEKKVEKNEEAQADKVEEKKPDELEECQKNAEEFKSKYLRALADYQNLERRTREERIEMIKIVQARVIEELLPVLDTLNQAEVFIKDLGLKMVKDTFIQKLKDLGVEEVELLNKEYDPNLAEAIEAVEGEKDNVVVEVLQKPYQMSGKIIRVGRVKVSKKTTKN